MTILSVVAVVSFAVLMADAGYQLLWGIDKRHDKAMAEIDTRYRAAMARIASESEARLTEINEQSRRVGVVFAACRRDPRLTARMSAEWSRGGLNAVAAMYDEIAGSKS